LIMKKLLIRENFHRFFIILFFFTIATTICKHNIWLTILCCPLIAVVISEYGLRIFFSVTNDIFLSWPPNVQIINRIAPGVISEDKCDSRFYTNSAGIRGEEFSDDQQYRILAIGGSVTISYYIDQKKTWTYILQDKLNHLEILNVWVGSTGTGGLCTREHIMHMRHLLPQYPAIDTVIVLAGCSDLLRRLIDDNKYDPNFLTHYDYWYGRLSRGAFYEIPYHSKKFRIKTGHLGETAIAHFIQAAKSFYFRKREEHQDNVGGMLIDFRERRKNAVMKNKLPDLSSALEEYALNLNAMIDIAEARSIRLILMTHPFLWGPNLTQEEKELLWCGWIEGMKSGRCYSNEALMDGMNRYNDKLLEVSQLRGVESIDLAKALPRNKSVFYDDVHFNVEGSERAATVISDYLARREPFLKK